MFGNNKKLMGRIRLYLSGVSNEGGRTYRDEEILVKRLENKKRKEIGGNISPLSCLSNVKLV